MRQRRSPVTALQQLSLLLLAVAAPLLGLVPAPVHGLAVGTPPWSGSTTPTEIAPNATTSSAHYFTLMRKYLGEEAFAQHACLATQEREGWKGGAAAAAAARYGEQPKGHDAADGKPMPVFTFGVEGSGHHAIETLLSASGGHGFSTIAGDGAAESIPFGWRRHQTITKRRSHPDLHQKVQAGTLLIALLRYPPSSLLSSVNRFQNRSGDGTRTRTNHNGQLVEVLRVTGSDEVYTLHDSLSYVNAALRFPGFDCDRLVIIPFELLTQHPMALYGPLSQAMNLDAMGSEGHALLQKRLKNMELHEEMAAILGPGGRYRIVEQICQDLALSESGNNAPWEFVHIAQHLRSKMEAASGGDAVPFQQMACEDRLYAVAEEYFDSRRYMFPLVYPSHQLVRASRAGHPRSGLHFEDLLLNASTDEP